MFYHLKNSRTHLLVSQEGWAALGLSARGEWGNGQLPLHIMVSNSSPSIHALLTPKTIGAGSHLERPLRPTIGLKCVLSHFGIDSWLGSSWLANRGNIEQSCFSSSAAPRPGAWPKQSRSHTPPNTTRSQNNMQIKQQTNCIPAPLFIFEFTSSLSCAETSHVQHLLKKGLNL